MIGPKCTSECKRFGHGDHCWLPDSLPRIPSHVTSSRGVDGEQDLSSKKFLVLSFNFMRRNGLFLNKSLSGSLFLTNCCVFEKKYRSAHKSNFLVFFALWDIFSALLIERIETALISFFTMTKLAVD